MATSLFAHCSDADSSQGIGVGKLQQLCASLGHEMDEEEARRLFATLDTDGDGHVSADEFKAWSAQGVAAAPQAPQGSPRAPVPDGAAAERRASRRADMDGFHEHTVHEKEGPGRETYHRGSRSTRQASSKQ